MAAPVQRRGSCGTVAAGRCVAPQRMDRGCGRSAGACAQLRPQLPPLDLELELGLGRLPPGWVVQVGRRASWQDRTRGRRRCHHCHPPLSPVRCRIRTGLDPGLGMQAVSRYMKGGARLFGGMKHLHMHGGESVKETVGVAVHALVHVQRHEHAFAMVGHHNRSGSKPLTSGQ
jgi:hypothetical protein